MFISTRKPFSPQEPDWETYKRFIKLRLPEQLYTIDSYLNSFIDDCGSYQINDLGGIETMLSVLPRPDAGTNQYYQLAINLSKEPEPELNSSITRLGCDLSDWTQTSSLLNCGPWKGKLAAIAGRINEHGLLSLDDARLAQKLLPEVWGDDEPHAHVDIWLLCRIDGR